jgi:hypothetical protein
MYSKGHPMKAYLVRFLLACHVLTNFAGAAIFSSSRLTIDFTDPNDARTKAIWSEPNLITTTKQGLGWDGTESSSRDIWFQTVELPIGLCWRPAQSANIVVEVEPTGKTRDSCAGAMFVRHSPDARHWSSWHAIQLKDPQDKQKSKYEYTTLVAVPRKNRKEYVQYHLQYQQLDVPWKADADALAKWIIEREPNFFDKPPPFIGYLQFLYEVSLTGGQRIARFDAVASWAVSGLHVRPNDPDFRMNLASPWGYRTHYSH